MQEGLGEGGVEWKVYTMHLQIKEYELSLGQDKTKQKENVFQNLSKLLNAVIKECFF